MPRITKPRLIKYNEASSILKRTIHIPTTNKKSSDPKSIYRIPKALFLTCIQTLQPMLLYKELRTDVKSLDFLTKHFIRCFLLLLYIKTM